MEAKTGTFKRDLDRYLNEYGTEDMELKQTGRISIDRHVGHERPISMLHKSMAVNISIIVFRRHFVIY